MDLNIDPVLQLLAMMLERKPQKRKEQQKRGHSWTQTTLL